MDGGTTARAIDDMGRPSSEIPHMPPLRLTLLALTVSVCVLPSPEATAGIDFSTATFNNMNITQNDSLGFAVTADVLEGGTVVGSLTAGYTYGGGTTPFNSGSFWGPTANAFRIFGETTNSFNGSDTADGRWNISVTPNAGYQVDGISLYTNGSILANPDFVGVTTNGNATVFDNGSGNGLITNYADGDPFIDGTNLLFAGGTHNNGILSTVHSNNWALNAAGATTLAFKYEAGFDEPVNGIAVEGIWFDVQLSASMPEPSSLYLLLLGAFPVAFRRERRQTA